MGAGEEGEETGRLEGGCGQGRGPAPLTREVVQRTRQLPVPSRYCRVSIHFPPRPSTPHPHPIPTGSGTLFKAYMVIRKNETEWGEKSQTHHEGQFWPTDPKLPRSQQKAVSSVTKLLLPGRAPSSVPQIPQLEFASLSQQMIRIWTAHLAASPPPLSKRERGKKKGKKREGKRQVRAVSFGRRASEASTAPFPVKGSRDSGREAIHTTESRGSLQDRELLCQLGV